MARILFNFTKWWLLSFSLLITLACQPQNTDVLLTTDQLQIRTSDLPLSTQIQLYESAMTQFQQTKLAIQQAAKPKQAAVQTITDFVSPPSPPKAHINGTPFWSHKEGNGRHQIDWVCSYQSANCARLNAALQALLPFLEGGYQLNYYHAPQRFHKFAHQAALGELCISQSEQRRLYRDYLWQQTGNLTPDVIKTGLLQRGLSPQTISTCLTNETLQQGLYEHTHELAEQKLLTQTSLWFNRIYVSQHHWQTELLGLLKPHLAVKPASNTIQDSGLVLNQLWQDPHAQTSWGQYYDEAAQQPSHIELNQPWPFTSRLPVKSTAWVYQLSAQHIVLLQGGELLTLAVSQAKSKTNDAVVSELEGDNLHQPSSLDDALVENEQHADSTSDSQQNDDQENDLTEKDLAQSNLQESDSDLSEAERHRQRYEQAVAAAPLQPLSAQWLDQQLLRQSELEQQLEPTPHEVEGHALLKLNSHEVDSFYQTLGIQPGDVIVRVNDQWIHQGNNPLWDLLQREERVTVSLIRKGLPVHLAFARQ